MRKKHTNCNSNDVDSSMNNTLRRLIDTESAESEDLSLADIRRLRGKNEDDTDVDNDELYTMILRGDEWNNQSS